MCEKNRPQYKWLCFDKNLSVLSEILLHVQTMTQMNKNSFEKYEASILPALKTTPLKIRSFQYGNFGLINVLQ